MLVSKEFSRKSSRFDRKGIGWCCMFKDFAFKRFEFEIEVACLAVSGAVFAFWGRKHRLDSPCPGNQCFSFQKCEIWRVVHHLGNGAVQEECKLIRGICFFIRSRKAQGSSNNSHFALKTSLDTLDPQTAVFKRNICPLFRCSSHLWDL